MEGCSGVIDEELLARAAEDNFLFCNEAGETDCVDWNFLVRCAAGVGNSLVVLF